MQNNGKKKSNNGINLILWHLIFHQRLILQKGNKDEANKNKFMSNTLVNKDTLNLTMKQNQDHKEIKFDIANLESNLNSDFEMVKTYSNGSCASFDTATIKDPLPAKNERKLSLYRKLKSVKVNRGKSRLKLNKNKAASVEPIKENSKETISQYRSRSSSPYSKKAFFKRKKRCDSVHENCKNEMIKSREFNMKIGKNSPNKNYQTRYFLTSITEL